MLNILGKYSIRQQILISFALIIIFIIFSLTFASLNVQKTQLIAMMEKQMQDSCKTLIDQINILYASVDSREFDNKVKYFTSAQRAEYNEQGYSLNQLFIDRKHNIIFFDNNFEYPLLDSEIIDEMFNLHKGIVHITSETINYTIAYEYSFEKRAIVALIVPQKDYLAPLIKLRKTNIITGAIALFFSMLIAGVLIMNITKPISNIITAAREIQKGNLDFHIKENGTAKEIKLLGKTFNRMLNAIREFVIYLKDLIQNLSKKSMELKNSAQEISQDANYLLNSLEDTEKHLNKQKIYLLKNIEIMAKLLETTVDIKKSNNVSFDVSSTILDMSDDGKKTLATVDEKMNDIYLSIQKTKDAFALLNNNFNEIIKINSAVKDISKNTGLLALNATIEAARAGEAGNSFMVVAQEISKLSQESHEFSQRTNHLIQNILIEFNSVKKSIEKMYSEILNSTEVVNSSASTFNNIYSLVIDNHQNIAEINNANQFIITLIEDMDIQINSAKEHTESIYNNIPPMLEAALKQRDNTLSGIEHSLYLDNISEKLKIAINSMDRPKLLESNKSIQ